MQNGQSYQLCENKIKMKCLYNIITVLEITNTISLLPFCIARRFTVLDTQHYWEYKWYIAYTPLPQILDIIYAKATG